MLEHLNGLIGIAAVVVALFSGGFVGLSRSKVADLRGSLEDSDKENQRLAKRVEERDIEIGELKKKRSEDAERITDLETVVRIATGEAKAQAILDLLDHHHTSAEAHWRAAKEYQGETSDLLRQVLEMLARRRSE